MYRAGDTCRVSGVAKSSGYPFREPLAFPASDDQPTETVWFSITDDTQDFCVVHDTCWELLRRFFYDVPIPWERLFDTLRHRVSIRPCLARVQCSSPARTRRVDYIHPKIRARFKRKKLQAQRKGTAVFTKSDVFTVFPLEICYEIVKHLSMPDFYNLRLVSRYMGELFFYADFWASQFDPRGSRGWLSDLKERPLEKRPQGEDWHLLYWGTRLPLVSMRREAWFCCLWIKDMVTMVFPPWTSKNLQAPSKEKDYMWKKLKAKETGIQIPITQFHTFDIPSDLTTLVISMATVQKETFVTGLRFLSKENVVSVGDILPDSPIIPIQGVFDGFEVASCAGGIRALKVVVDQVSSSWFGKVPKNPTYSILTLPAQPDILRATFAVSSFNQKKKKHWSMTCC